MVVHDRYPFSNAVITGRFRETGGPYPPGGHGGVDYIPGPGDESTVLLTCDAWIDAIIPLSAGQAFGNWVRVRPLARDCYVAFAHLAGFAPGLEAGRFYYAGTPLGPMGGSGQGRLDAYAHHCHQGQATLANPWFGLEYDQLEDPLAYTEVEDMTLAEDLALSLYVTRDEIAQMNAGALPREELIGRARARMQTIIGASDPANYDPVGLYFEQQEHVGIAGIHHRHGQP